MSKSLSLGFSLLFYKLMYDEKGNFHPKVCTKTADAFLKAIQSKKIQLSIDTDVAHVNPEIDELQFVKALEQFAEQQAKPQLSQLKVNDPPQVAVS